MNDISWKWKGELLLLTTNSLIPCDRQTDLWHMQLCSPSRKGRCVQQVAEGEAEVKNPWSRAPAPGGCQKWSPASSVWHSVSGRWVSLSRNSPSLQILSSHSLTLRGQSQSARLCPQTSASDQISVLCLLITSVCCGNSTLMCCFVLRDPLMTLLYQLMEEEVMEI